MCCICEFADFTAIPAPSSDSSICRAFLSSFVRLSFGPLDMDMEQQTCSLGTTLCWRLRLVLSLGREGISKLTFLVVFCCCAVAVPHSPVGSQDQRGFGLVSNCYNGAYGTKDTCRLNIDSLHCIYSCHLYFRLPMPSALCGLGRWHWNMLTWVSYRQHCLCCISC